MRFGTSLVASAVGLLAFALTGCDSCGSKKPYTPFTIPSAQVPSAPRPSESALAPPSSLDAGHGVFRKEELAPADATHWQLGERAIDAPPGRKFERAVRADFDGDAKEDVATWTLPQNPEPSSAPGELWFYPAAGAPRILGTLASFIPTGPGCRLVTVLAQSGAQSLTLDTAAECEARLVARSPVRALSIFRPASERPAVLTLRLAAPAPSEQWTISVDSSDRDGDGRDDVNVEFTLQSAGSARPATAHFAWLDRAAGASRESNEPARSLAAAAGQEVTRARGKANSRTTADGVGNLRRLSFSLCAESGTARVFDEDGSPLNCGNLQAFTDKLASAEFHAALTQKDPREALGVFVRDGWYYGKMSEAQRKQLLKELEKAVPSVDVTRALPLEPVPAPRTAAVRYAPLRFDAQGNLLVQTTAGVRQVSPDGTKVEELEDSARWPLEVTGPGDSRFNNVIYACDRSEVLLLSSGPAPREPEPTPLLAPRPGSCKGGALPAMSPPFVVSFQGAAPEVLIGGKLVGPKTNAGSARPLAVPTPLGLLVTTAEKAELWRVSDANLSPSNVSDCVVASGGAAVACVVEGRARLLLK